MPCVDFPGPQIVKGLLVFFNYIVVKRLDTLSFPLAMDNRKETTMLLYIATLFLLLLRQLDLF